MKKIIIRIKDISEIDTSRITVYDLNNRYIDSKGEMFGLKYNQVTKKIDIIKIIRKHKTEATRITPRKDREKNNDIQLSQIEEFMPAEEEEIDDNSFPESEPSIDPSSFDPVLFIEDSMTMILTHKERLHGIMMNLKNSNYISEDNRTDNIGLDDYFRSINIEGIQKIDKIVNYQKELTSYPRSISYYQAKIDKKGREIIDQLGGDKVKIMKFIYLFEMFYSLRGAYRQLKKILGDLDKFLAGVEHKSKTYQEKAQTQAFNDANVSLKNTTHDIEDLLDKLDLLEQYLYNLENY